MVTLLDDRDDREAFATTATHQAARRLREGGGGVCGWSRRPRGLRDDRDAYPPAPDDRDDRDAYPPAPDDRDDRDASPRLITPSLARGVGRGGGGFGGCPPVVAARRLSEGGGGVCGWRRGFGGVPREA